MTTLRIVLMALVRDDGSVLLRMRDEQSVTRPNRWSLPGGAVEPGEDPVTAARRLVSAQTGLALAGEPVAVWRGYLPGVPAEVHFYAGATTATQDQIVDPAGFVSEFVPGVDLQSGRAFSPATGFVLARFVDEPRYQALINQPEAEELA